MGLLISKRDRELLNKVITIGERIANMLETVVDGKELVVTVSIELSEKKGISQ